MNGLRLQKSLVTMRSALTLLLRPKTNPPPNISCRYFTYSTEFIIWARKSEKVPHYYNYELMKRINGNTQKPLGLLSRIIMASTKPGAWILDPFAGSSTTGIAANLLGRQFLGIEREAEFAAMSKARREEIERIENYAGYRRKIQDIMKAEDTQTDIFSCCEPEPFEELPFENVAKVEKVHLKKQKNKIFMYAIGPSPRLKTEPTGKLAIGLKDSGLDNILVSDIGYIMFHYWKNENATPYKLIKSPRIVDEKEIPDGYMVRMTKDSQRFLLLDYKPSKPAKIGAFDILKVQQKGKVRYLPFVTTKEMIAK